MTRPNRRTWQVSVRLKPEIGDRLRTLAGCSPQARRNGGFDS